MGSPLSSDAEAVTSSNADRGMPAVESMPNDFVLATRRKGLSEPPAGRRAHLSQMQARHGVTATMVSFFAKAFRVPAKHYLFLLLTSAKTIVVMGLVGALLSMLYFKWVYFQAGAKFYVSCGALLVFDIWVFYAAATRWFLEGFSRSFPDCVLPDAGVVPVGSMFVAGNVIVGSSFLGGFLCLVPGLLLFWMHLFVPVVMVETGLGPFPAMKRSRRIFFEKFRTLIPAMLVGTLCLLLAGLPPMLFSNDYAVTALEWWLTTLAIYLPSLLFISLALRVLCLVYHDHFYEVVA